MLYVFLKENLYFLTLFQKKVVTILTDSYYKTLITKIK